MVCDGTAPAMTSLNHKKIELLAPARNLECAVAAIDCGADAVYMGAPRFGARHAASNTVNDIRQAARYAHAFGARLYVTLNTVLFDHELNDARTLALQVADAGADALIVQDMAFLEMGLRGIELHASTQTFNLSPEKVRFLHEAGFARVILERNISLDNIAAIRAATDVELECFVHGAICVCYSGRCYMSRSMSARSGNRGDCMQACRLSYDLCDSHGNILIPHSHILSVMDLDLSARLGELLDAGVSSFKIEGRLKDISYVKNTVAYYRQCLDREINLRNGLQRASSGTSLIPFTPDISKSFSRGFTQYFIDGRRAGVSDPMSPKSKGTLLGKVVRSGATWFELDADSDLIPGDGISFMHNGTLSGSNVNAVRNRRISINNNITLPVGVQVFRNRDHRFNSLVENASVKRKLNVAIKVLIDEVSIRLRFRDEDGFTVDVDASPNNGPARDKSVLYNTLLTQLSRSGDTPFEVTEVTMRYSDGSDWTLHEVPFMRVAEINALRRQGLDTLWQLRAERKPVPVVVEPHRVEYPYPVSSAENVTNRLARNFYERHGVHDVPDGYDMLSDLTGVTVMKTPFCVRRENGMCQKSSRRNAEPLFLRHGTFRYRLEFDCMACEMSVVALGNLDNL